ncbi:MAG: hypothetical protein LBF83_11540 [Spirochaetaceae bacterium]|nr:hypothetical protein [Spirochaetaceae bacterium]
MSYLLDACALLAFINKETGWTIVDGLLKQAAAGDAVLFMNAINFYETVTIQSPLPFCIFIQK